MELLIGHFFTSVCLGLAAGIASKSKSVGILVGFGVLGFLTVLLVLARTYGVAH